MSIAAALKFATVLLFMSTLVISAEEQLYLIAGNPTPKGTDTYPASLLPGDIYLGVHAMRMGASLATGQGVFLTNGNLVAVTPLNLGKIIRENLCDMSLGPRTTR